MEIKFKTWGGETIHMESDDSDYVKVTVSSSESEYPNSVEMTLSEEDAARLLNGLAILGA